ncbi:LysM peptidoglycan-binding domain-containing protein [Candidatus Gracilibacteria bacterium]|nr:LysM peptidoglycan-binding domain-containing protein [Candidatus Gracilibacteria bacterium]
MTIRPNHKARHARAGRSNIDMPSASDTFRKFKWFTLGLIVIFPIYPSLSLLGSGGTVRAGDYDDSTIITAYSDLGDVSGEGYISDTGLIRVGGGSSGESRIATTPTTTDGVAVAPNSVKKHTVKPKESVRSISDIYGISTDAILWANDLSADDELEIGQILKIPPVSGVVHTVVDGDTISAIAAKYQVDTTDIVSINSLRDAASIRIGMDLMIPGAMKRSVAVIGSPKTLPTKVALSKGATQIKDMNTTHIAPQPPVVTISSKTGIKDRYAVKYTGKSRGFVGGNCTWYVAQNKSVTWRGNANAWMQNAKAAGVQTGQSPIVGAIVQFSGSGYNRSYGHVGIVAGIEGNNLIVKDMNYRGLYEITIRKVPISHPSIDGYIYID